MAWAAATPSPAAPARIEYNRDVRPILSENCFACHGADAASRKGKLRLDSFAEATAKREDGSPAIVPGKPKESEVIRRIFVTDDDLMPPEKSHKILSATQKDLLKRWVAQGAEYQPHWAFIPVPKQVSVPTPADPAKWVSQPLDAFVLDRLRQLKLDPAVETSREKWLRRASFDLTGLPPTLAELDAFLADQSPQAFETAADRLLKSPAFGERMANEWLDVARYVHAQVAGDGDDLVCRAGSST